MTGPENQAPNDPDFTEKIIGSSESEYRTELSSEAKVALTFSEENEVLADGTRVPVSGLELDILKIIYVAGQRPVSYGQVFRWLQAVRRNLTPETLDAALILVNREYKFGNLRRPIRALQKPGSSERFFVLDEQVERPPLDREQQVELLSDLLPRLPGQAPVKQHIKRPGTK